ncbi:MAG: ABC transporter ATP-binding protein, partial [Acidimicrobiia bacterium]
VLAGLTPYQGGTLRVLGEAVNGPRRDVGFVFQHLALLPWRTVLDNVLLPAELLGKSRKEATPQALECLRKVGLEGYESYYLREISGGMQQRVALSRVLMTPSRVLLLDEPFGALDELTRESVSMLFLDICQQTGAATVLVTHSIQEAVLMSDRVLVMPPNAEGQAQWITVDIPRPRGYEMMLTEGFIQAVGEVRAALGLPT